MKKTILNVALITLALTLGLGGSVDANYIVDTGPGYSSPSSNVSVLDNGQWLAGKFTLNDESYINGLEGWMYMYNSWAPGEVNAAIYTNELVGQDYLPGERLYSQGFSMGPITAVRHAN